MARAVSLPPRPRRPREGRPPDQGKGRGARSNNSGRYEPISREDFEDGWDDLNVDGGENADNSSGDDGRQSAPAPKTEITFDASRSIINYVESPFVGFDRSINPYRGCEHGCIYCFARPSHAYLGLSPGLDFETKLFAKPNAAALLEKELRHKRYTPKHIAIGTNTDPYQPAERRLRVMRGVLGVLSQFNHPVSVLTKGALITRDIDILAPMAERNLTRTMLSITTLQPALARAMEPRASSPRRRFDAVRALAEAGVPVGVMTAPMIPGLNDNEMEELLETAKDAGASFAGYTIIRLPLEVSTLFKEWVEAHFPDRARRVMNHIREMNGGRDYDPKWSRAAEPQSVYARLIASRFKQAVRRLDLNREKQPLDLSQFGPPDEPATQLQLFD